MTTSTFPARFTRVLLLGLVVLGTAASVAGARALIGRPMDVRPAAAAVPSTPQSLKAVCPCNRDLPQAYQPSGRPAASFSTPQGLKADGLRLQAIARAYQSQRVASFSTPQGLKADGLRLQGMAQAYQSRLTGDSHPGGFDWGDYVIGIGSGVGLTLVLAGGLVIGRQRRHPQTA